MWKKGLTDSARLLKFSVDKDAGGRRRGVSEGIGGYSEDIEMNAFGALDDPSSHSPPRVAPCLSGYPKTGRLLD